MNPQVGFLLNKTLEALRNSSLESAELYLKQAIRLQSNNPHALRLLGVISAQRQQYSDALKYLNDSLKVLPKNALALSNLGNVFLKIKEYGKALDAYEKSIKIDPKYDEVWSNKGNALHELKRYDEAIAHYDKALSLNPNYADGWSNKGWTLDTLKDYNGAIAHYDRALNLKPDLEWVFGYLLHARMKIGSWSGLESYLTSAFERVMANEKVTNPFPLLSLTDDSLLHKKSSEIYVQNKHPKNLALGPIHKHGPQKKICIGYFSADFRNHPVSLLTSELFELHDKSRFEIIAFSFGADDKSPIRLRLSQAFDKFIDVSSMSDLDIAILSRNLNVDVAVDLSGHTADSRLGIFAYQAAPIQVNWLGYPGTIGSEFIDYIVADQVLIPKEQQQFYTEKVVYLPNTYMVDDSKRVASSKRFTRAECGLPENAFVFCCFNNDYKFNAKVLDSWSRILLMMEKSVLWISANNKCFASNILGEFEKRGINSSRIVFAKREELMADHLARYSLADVFLDTHPYNAHTTAVDSLKMGIPVITLVGQSFASRVAASLLNAINVPELITNTEEEYESLAIDLAMNPQKLAGIKQRLTNNRLTTALFDTPLFTKNLEAAYIKMYERYQAHSLPDHILIE